MASTSVQAERELIYLENKYWQAIKDKDVDAAMRLTDDTCIITGAQGIAHIGRDGMEKMMAARFTIDDFEVKDVEVRMIGDDVGIVAYSVHEHLTIDGQPVSLDAADSSTWVRRNGRWRCALHTEAITGDPFGRDR